MADFFHFLFFICEVDYVIVHVLSMFFYKLFAYQLDNFFDLQGDAVVLLQFFTNRLDETESISNYLNYFTAMFLNKIIQVHPKMRNNDALSLFV